MKALLLIGLQVDLLPGGPAEVPGSQSLVQAINEIAPKYDLVATASFSLPADHVIFAANHPWRRPGQLIPINGQLTLLHPIFCVPGSFGAELIPGLNLPKIAFDAAMGTVQSIPPHSAFFDFGKKRDTGLADFLASHNITELHLAGMPLETAVINTALDARALGFEVSILSNACFGHSEEAMQAQMGLAENAGVTIKII